jgi:hypothetical protein
MDELEERLHRLVTETCRYLPGSSKRQRGLTQIVRLIIKSGKLWKDNAPYYEDALQQTWLYLCRNLCENVTGDKYSPDRGTIITWLNGYLRWRLQDCRIQEQTRQAQTASGQRLGLDRTIDPVETLEASPDIPPILEATRQWAETDLDGELRCSHIQGHPELTCQVLILRRLPPETSWKALAAEYNLSISTLSSFYQRQCIPRLRNFGKSERYL